MRVSVFPTVLSVIPEVLLNRSSVVIDVLRATTTIVQALSAGARAVVPVQSPEEAVYRAQPFHDALLGGERDALRIEGFDLGNSPEEYSADRVRGKTVFLTTTNGTRALHAARTAAPVWVGALVNASAAARRLIACQQDAVILCSGTNDQFSLEDTVCAGAILAALDDKAELDDLGLMALLIFRSHQADLPGLLRRSPHVQRLNALGLSRDVDWAVRLDITEVVPVLRCGQIVVDL